MPKMSALERTALAELEARMKGYERQLQQAMVKALDDMRSQMSKIYEKWAKGGKLTRAEMTRYNKYQTMEKQILASLDPALKATVGVIKKLPPSVYHDSFFRYAWAVDNAVEARLSWGTYNEKAIAELFSITNPKNVELANALANYGPRAKTRIRNAMLKGLTEGKGYTAMIADLKAALGNASWEALRIARTEGQRAMNLGQYDAYLQAKQQGVRGNDVWDATLDGRTRESHGRADGQKRGKDGYFYVGGRKAEYPADPNLPAKESINCRCRLRFEIEGYEPLLRRSGDEGVIPYQTYDDWLKTRPIPPSGGRSTKAPKTPSLPTFKVPKAPPPVSVAPSPTPIPRKASDPFVPATTIEEANRYAMDVLGARFANYSGVSVGLANEMNQGVRAAVAAMPKVSDHLQDLGTWQAMRTENRNRYAATALANASKNGVAPGQMQIVDKVARRLADAQFPKPDDKTTAAFISDWPRKRSVGTFYNTRVVNLPGIDTILRRDVASGYHPPGCDTFKGIVSHEIGHAIDETIGVAMGARNLSDTKLFKDFLKQFDGQIATGLSRYGATFGPDEILAEAWCEYTCATSPRPIAVAIGQWVIKQYKKVVK